MAKGKLGGRRFAVVQESTVFLKKKRCEAVLSLSSENYLAHAKSVKMGLMGFFIKQWVTA